MQFLDPQTLKTPDAIFSEIERVLLHMREMAFALTADDIRHRGGLTAFEDQVTWLKGHYERLEAMLIEAGI